MHRWCVGPGSSRGRALARGTIRILRWAGQRNRIGQLDRQCRVDDGAERARRVDHRDGGAGTSRWNRGRRAAARTPEPRRDVDQRTCMRQQMLREVDQVILAVQFDQRATIASAPQLLG